MILSNDSPLIGTMIDKGREYGDDTEDEPILPECPNCGASAYYTGEAEEFYQRGGKVIGCNVCIRRIDVYGEEVA